MDLETKATFTPEIGHTLKLMWDSSRCVPKCLFTTLFNRKPMFMGVNYTFDYEAPKMSGPLETLLGVRLYKNIIAYIKK